MFGCLNLRRRDAYHAAIFVCLETTLIAQGIDYGSKIPLNTVLKFPVPIEF